MNFSETDYLNKVKDLNLPYYLSIVKGKYVDSCLSEGYLY